MKNLFLFIIGFIFFLVFLIAAFSFISNSNQDDKYPDQKQNTEEIKKSPSDNQDQYLHTNKLHFDHMPITYYFSDPLLTNKKDRKKCPNHQIQRLKKAFSEIETRTEALISFKEVEKEGDIAVNCYGVATSDQFHTLSGEGGYKSQENIIISGELNFYVHRNCGNYPDLELHEILHVFGFNHVDDKNSIMYPEQIKCDGKVDDLITEELIKIYMK